MIIVSNCQLEEIWLNIIKILPSSRFYQAHPEELGAIVKIVKSGMVTNVLGSQYKLHNDAKCDTMGALWSILGVSDSAQWVLDEAIGFLFCLPRSIVSKVMESTQINLL
jgi:hypothetical protein